MQGWHTGSDIYAFHRIVSMHTCSNSSNISSNWHCINILVCSYMDANVAGVYWLGTTKPSFNEVSFSSDSCLELCTYTASKLCDYLFFYRSVQCHNQAMWLLGTPNPYRSSILVRSIRYIPFVGLWSQRITRTLGSFHASIAINTLLRLTT